MGEFSQQRMNWVSPAEESSRQDTLIPCLPLRHSSSPLKGWPSVFDDQGDSYLHFPRVFVSFFFINIPQIDHVIWHCTVDLQVLRLLLVVFFRGGGSDENIYRNHHHRCHCWFEGVPKKTSGVTGQYFPSIHRTTPQQSGRHFHHLCGLVESRGREESKTTRKPFLKHWTGIAD